MTVPMAIMPTVTMANMIAPTMNSALKYWAKLPTLTVSVCSMSRFQGAGTWA